MNFNKISHASILVVFSFLPFTLLTGPFLSDLSISICGIIILIYFLINKNYEYFKNLIVKIYIIWCLYLIANSILSENIILSFESSLFYFRFGFFSLALFYLLSINSKNIVYFYYISFFLLFIVFIDSIFQITTGSNLLGFQYINFRLSSFFNTELILGSYVSRINIINFVILYLFFRDSLRMKVIFYIFFPMSFLIVLYTGERTALFNMLCVFLFFIIFVTENKIFKLFTLFIISSILFFLLTTSNSISERIINHTFSSNQINISGEGRLKVFSSVHEQHYISAMKMFNDNQFFGIGPKMFREYCKKEEYFTKNACATHPHNYYVQLLAETGIIGTLPLIILFLFTIYKYIMGIYLIGSKKYSLYIENSLISLLPLSIFLFPFIPSSNFFNNWVSIYTYISIGIILYNYINFKKR